MSFLIKKLADHVGERVADGIKGALGAGEDDEDKKDKDDDGGFLSIFKKDDKKDEDEDDHKGGLFSFGKDKEKDREKDDDRNFFEKIFKRDEDDDDDEKVSKKTGFAGLWTEPDQPGAVRFEEGDPGGEGACGHMAEEDLDLMSDLMEVAKES